jgi:hypothetical protein
MHFVLMYDFSSDYLQRRGAFRNQHLALAWAAQQRGDVILGGALGDPPDGGMLLFQGDSPAVAQSFANADPYVTGGLVTRWRVIQWTTVVGKDAAMPMRPAEE